MSQLRVVSLLPSATEIICALGAGEALVGVSHECDYPEQVRRLPVLTRSRVDANGSSQAIDAAVRAAIPDALSIYTVDERRLAELEPDLIVTQDLCEVCAVSLDDVRSAVARLAGQNSITILSLRPTRLADVLGDVQRVADALGAPERAEPLVRSLRERIDAISRKASNVSARPRVVSVEWLDPLMLGGTWMPELIESAGGAPVGAIAGAAAPSVDAALLESLGADVVVVKPCGFTLERTLRERTLIEHSVRAHVGPAARIYVTDGNAFFNRPGPRLVESLEIMAACVHPDVFPELVEKHRSEIVELVA